MTDEDKELEGFYKKVGKKLTDLRKAAGYTNQESFAHDAGIARGQYGRYENGSNITIGKLYKILKFHNISFEEFFNQSFN